MRAVRASPKTPRPALPSVYKGSLTLRPWLFNCLYLYFDSHPSTSSVVLVPLPISLPFAASRKSSTHQMARRSQQANSSASEREPLLGDGRSNHDDHEPTARHGAPCIYDRASVKIVFACGAVLVCVK